MKKISKDTKLCISLSSNASNFGTILHNSLYDSLELDFIYKSFTVKDIEPALEAIKTLNIRGCGISMPFKEKVITYLDELDDLAELTGSVNTVVNNNGKLKGYNTDINGAIESIKKMKIDKSESIFLLGAGGAARAFLYALNNCGLSNIAISNRNSSKLSNLRKISDFKIIDWGKKKDYKADILINATPIGMFPKVDTIAFDEFNISNARGIIDVVVNPIISKLIKKSEDMKKNFCPGYIMSMHQAKEQFFLYTGVNPPLRLVEEKLMLLLKLSEPV